MSRAPRPLRQLLRAPLEPGDAQRLWRRVETQRRARESRRTFASALAFAGALGLLLFSYRGELLGASANERARVQPPVAAPRVPLRLASGAAIATVEVPEGAAPHTLALSDGTRVALATGTRLAPREVSSARTELALERGVARFEVQPQRGRPFAVWSGALRVEVVGTVFTVERAADGGVRVGVEHGRVRVVAPGLLPEGVLVAAGEHLAWQPQSAAQPEAPAAVQPPPADASAAPAAAAAQAPAAPQAAVEPRTALAPAPAQVVARAEPQLPPWRAAAAAGNYAGAYALLGSAGFAQAVQVAATPGQLLELSDIARAASKPAPAAQALALLLERYPRSEQAGLAALTLGRMQLDTLAQPRAAARSLRRALELGLPLSLREDALAGVVHAYALAGDGPSAARAAADYRAAFPEGQLRASVDAWAASAD